MLFIYSLLHPEDSSYIAFKKMGMVVFRVDGSNPWKSHPEDTLGVVLEIRIQKSRLGYKWCRCMACLRTILYKLYIYIHITCSVLYSFIYQNSLSIYLFIYLSIYLSTYWSTHLSTYPLSTYPPIPLSFLSYLSYRYPICPICPVSLYVLMHIPI